MIGVTRYHSESLCWSCVNAVPNVTRLEDLCRDGAVGCPWSICIPPKPVEGWVAFKTIKSDYNRAYASYDVQECPMWREG